MCFGNGVKSEDSFFVSNAPTNTHSACRNPAPPGYDPYTMFCGKVSDGYLKGVLQRIRVGLALRKDHAYTTDDVRRGATGVSRFRLNVSGRCPDPLCRLNRNQCGRLSLPQIQTSRRISSRHNGVLWNRGTPLLGPATIFRWLHLPEMPSLKPRVGGICCGAPVLVKGAIRPTETYHNFDEELYDCPTGFVDAGFEDIPVGTYDWNKSPGFRK